jgi:ribonucleoside-diphosphate reductase alpha chain
MTFDDAKKKAKSFFNGNDIAADTYLKKYALTIGTGEFNKDGSEIQKYLEPTPDYMWKRLAKAGASIEEDKEKWEKEFYRVFEDFKAVPQGSIMFALGNTYQKSSCSNCFVFPLEDSIDEGEASIGQISTEMMRTYSYRGGCGVDLSNLRPTNAEVNNAAKQTSGAASWMEHFSNITRMIGINGRRGALMLTMGVDHPDIELFATMKHDLTKVTGANVSIKITDAFMKAVEQDKKWVASYSWNSSKTGKKESIKREWNARDLWKIIVDSATTTAEPGLLFWDNVIKNSPADCYADLGYKTISTNPCSELPLEAYGACTLLSMNLARYTSRDFTEDAKFNEEEFLKDVYVATRFLDNVKTIDAGLMPIKKQREHALESRRIGMGIHGLADAMANLRIKYDSDEGVNFIDSLFEKYTKAVYSASAELAKEKGPFPMFDAEREKDHPFLTRIGFAGVPRRNVACMTLAPTGTVSLLSQTSSGIEPVFRNIYTRRVKIHHNMTIKPEDKDRVYTDSMGDKWLEYKIYESNPQRYIKMNGTEELPEYFVTSEQIDWDKRVEIQAAITNWLDHSCSSTINLPKGTSTETVGNIYMKAWKSGCKGMTVYVDGCRDGVLITEDSKAESKKKVEVDGFNAIKRPKKIPCDIYQITADGEKWTVMVGLVDDKPYEIFCGKPKKVVLGKTEKGYIEKEGRGTYSLHIGDDTILKDISDIFTDTQGSITRLISTSLRHNVNIQFIVQQLEKSDGNITSFNKAIARVMKKYIKNGAKEQGAKCPECGQESIIREEGCVKCSSCGWTKC